MKEQECDVTIDQVTVRYGGRVMRMSLNMPCYPHIVPSNSIAELIMLNLSTDASGADTTMLLDMFPVEVLVNHLYKVAMAVDREKYSNLHKLELIVKEYFKDIARDIHFSKDSNVVRFMELLASDHIGETGVCCLLQACGAEMSFDLPWCSDDGVKVLQKVSDGRCRLFVAAGYAPAGVMLARFAYNGKRKYTRWMLSNYILSSNAVEAAASIAERRGRTKVLSDINNYLAAENE